MADTKKKATKKTAKRATAKSNETVDEQGPIDALQAAVDEARKAGLTVKAIATCNTEDKGGITVRF